MGVSASKLGRTRNTNQERLSWVVQVILLIGFLVQVISAL